MKVKNIKKYILKFVGLSALVLLLGVGFWMSRDSKKESKVVPQTITENSDDNGNANKDAGGIVPELSRQTLAEGLSVPWDIVMDDGGTLFFTQRSKGLFALDNGKVNQVVKPSDLVSVGESGMLGLEIVAGQMFTCFSRSEDIAVVRWDINNQKVSNRTDIVAGIPVNDGSLPGRHSGCRIAFGPDGYLWISTGDSANFSTPQDSGSLGGKILRVDTDGNAALGNLGGEFDPRIYSYGHRNTQGLTFFEEPKNGVLGLSISHGSGIDDEVNPLLPGNFGWDPNPTYSERGVPMTDFNKFPNAIAAWWSSGDRTIAPSGGNILIGEQWGAWEGRLAMAVLKDQHVRIQNYDDDGKLLEEIKILGDIGRVRHFYNAPDGNGYVLTSNGEGFDSIIKITPALNN